MRSAWPKVLVMEVLVVLGVVLVVLVVLEDQVGLAVDQVGLVVGQELPDNLQPRCMILSGLCCKFHQFLRLGSCRKNLHHPSCSNSISDRPQQLQPNRRKNLCISWLPKKRTRLW